MAMNILSRQIPDKTNLRRLLLGIGFGWAIACSASDEAPGGGRVEHPVEPGPKAPKLSSSIPLASASETPAPAPSQSAPSVAPSGEPSVESYMSPIDKEILEDHPSRPWSKNVPKRRCTKDEECGDGFCDRGRCASIWTWTASLGQRCSSGAQCADYLCIEGRCRSCISDAECTDEPDNQNPRCISEPFVPGSRGCVGVAPSIKGTGVPNNRVLPPLQK